MRAVRPKPRVSVLLQVQDQVKLSELASTLVVKQMHSNQRNSQFLLGEAILFGDPALSPRLG
jgi:hypothetical protein